MIRKLIRIFESPTSEYISENSSYPYPYPVLLKKESKEDTYLICEVFLHYRWQAVCTLFHCRIRWKMSSPFTIKPYNRIFVLCDTIFISFSNKNYAFYSFSQPTHNVYNACCKHTVYVLALLHWHCSEGGCVIVFAMLWVHLIWPGWLVATSSSQ